PSVLRAAGGQLEPLRAVLVGGYHGAWIAPDAIDDVGLDDTSLSRHGGSLGAGVIVAVGQSACPGPGPGPPIAPLAPPGPGRGGPCTTGLPAVADLLMAMAYGQAPHDARQLLDRWTRQIAGRGACHLPDGAVRFLRSGLGVFAEELAEHTQRGPCRACRRPTTLRFARAGAPPARAAA